VIDPEGLVPDYLNNAETIGLILSTMIELGGTRFSSNVLLQGSSFARRSKTLAAIETLVDTGILVRTSPTLYQLLCPQDDIQQLFYLLRGAKIAKSLLKEEPEFELVMTSPRKPNALQDVLEKIGPKKCQISRTDEVFEDLAKKAQSKLTVMTPFLDKTGAKFLLNLLSSAGPDVEKRLILRFLSLGSDHARYPTGYDNIKDDLRNLNVSVYDYALKRDNTAWLETFHAKTILADDEYAYIGSSNLDRYSLDNSLELGVFLQGGSVLLIKELIDGIVSISCEHRWSQTDS